MMVAAIAMLAHAANRAYCPSWEDAPHASRAFSTSAAEHDWITITHCWKPWFQQENKHEYAADFLQNR